jgi:hypothetical protein
VFLLEMLKLPHRRTQVLHRLGHGKRLYRPRPISQPHRSAQGVRRSFSPSVPGNPFDLVVITEYIPG